MTPKTAIQKGKLLEKWISEQIRLKGLDARAERSHGSGSGTREKADISTSLQVMGRNLGIEAKNHATAKVQAWWKQAEKLEKLGREPIVVYKLKNEPLEASKAIIYLDTLLDLIKQAQEPKLLVSDNKEQIWAVDNLRLACNKVLKLLK